MQQSNYGYFNQSTQQEQRDQIFMEQSKVRLLTFVHNLKMGFRYPDSAFDFWTNLIMEGEVIVKKPMLKPQRQNQQNPLPNSFTNIQFPMHQTVDVTASSKLSKNFIDLDSQQRAMSPVPNKGDFISQLHSHPFTLNRHFTQSSTPSEFPGTVNKQYLNQAPLINHSRSPANDNLSSNESEQTDDSTTEKEDDSYQRKRRKKTNITPEAENTAFITQFESILLNYSDKMDQLKNATDFTIVDCYRYLNLKGISKPRGHPNHSYYAKYILQPFYHHKNIVFKQIRAP